MDGCLNQELLLEVTPELRVETGLQMEDSLVCVRVNTNPTSEAKCILPETVLAVAERALPVSDKIKTADAVNTV